MDLHAINNEELDAVSFVVLWVHNFESFLAQRLTFRLGIHYQSHICFLQVFQAVLPTEPCHCLILRDVFS